ncbi:CMGC/DYRK/DYRK2 protein kinase [Sphaeroforma arctica JP610]|uniref:dual-specificity kinase n=1 Tax=Sphaeroforma arctica JP610 TaxID=667725 RepID=A0A0L0FL52_9EUKA|nr:CMGC/DYRK/DYRK2 protein kinase [Sphaeroforma arctica JP610]KNC77196.1 CMGC/DYRK/DYRK2 protein kinase [Sphaeroforma arctica JP610]|eukprot:XP_014151098.1 CMGC/DYRK/DYRK2 protein kinase [Sphaeroforma arctica JP610]
MTQGLGLDRGAGGNVATGGFLRHTLDSLQSQYKDVSVDASTNTQRAPAQPRNYMTPEEAVARYGSQLSRQELAEIHKVKRVYYLGQNANKSAHYQGYDESNGDYIIVLHDHLNFRYELLESLGKGSFGHVMKAYDHMNKQLVAVKIIRNKKRFHAQALIEVKVLEHLKKEDYQNSNNVVHIIDHFYARDHLCITFELLSLNLYELIKANRFKGLSLKLIMKIGTQILSSLSLFDRLNIIHCDLKPENVLLKTSKTADIKVIDLGSSCYSQETLYSYIQSRFYRSPEVILGLPYDTSIDMWSFGCILAELYTGYPLFPGENETEQLAYIMEVYNTPPEHLIHESTRRASFFEENGTPKTVPNSKGKIHFPNSKLLSNVIKCRDQNFLHLLDCCLTWDPKERITPDDAMNHPFFISHQDAVPQSMSATPISSSQHQYTSQDSVGGTNSRGGVGVVPTNAQSAAQTMMHARPMRVTDKAPPQSVPRSYAQHQQSQQYGYPQHNTGFTAVYSDRLPATHRPHGF